MTNAATGEIVQFDNVGLRYGSDREVLSDVSFTLYPGSFYFLTGASGAGKTSLLKLLYLAQRPSRGAIRMFGTDAITMPRERLPFKSFDPPNLVGQLAVRPTDADVELRSVKLSDELFTLKAAAPAVPVTVAAALADPRPLPLTRPSPAGSRAARR